MTRKKKQPFRSLRSRWLVVHGADPVAWAKRHGIEAFTAPCGNCERPLTTSIPVASGSLRGLVAPACECGTTEWRPPYCMVTGPGGDLSDIFGGGQ